MEPWGTPHRCPQPRWDELLPDKYNEDTFIHLPADWGHAWKGLLLICQDGFGGTMAMDSTARGDAPEGRDEEWQNIWERPANAAWTHPVRWDHEANEDVPRQSRLRTAVQREGTELPCPETGHVNNRSAIQQIKTWKTGNCLEKKQKKTLGQKLEKPESVHRWGTPSSKMAKMEHQDLSSLQRAS